VLAIAIILYRRYKLQFVDIYHTKLYGVIVVPNILHLHVRVRLVSLFIKYSGITSKTSSPSVEKNGDKVVRET